MTIKQLLITLQREETNPEINKTYLTKLAKLTPEQVGDIAIDIDDQSIDNLDSDFVAKLKLGDIINTGDTVYFVGYDDDAEKDLVSLDVSGYISGEIYLHSDGEDEWTHDSTIRIRLQPMLETSSVNDGTINKVIGFASNGDLVKASPSSGGGTQLYKHTIVVNTTYVVFCPRSTPFTSLSDIIDYYSQVKYPLYGSMTYDGADYPIWLYPGGGSSASQITVARLKSGGITSFYIYQSEFVSDTVTPL